MNGPAHYEEAEKYLEILDIEQDTDAWAAAVASGEAAIAIQAAQAHATLALAAAMTDYKPKWRGMPDADIEMWESVAGVDRIHPKAGT